MVEINLSDFETAVGIYSEQLTATLDFTKSDPSFPAEDLENRKQRCITAIQNTSALKLWHEDNPDFIKRARTEAIARIQGVHDALDSLGEVDD